MKKSGTKVTTDTTFTNMEAALIRIEAHLVKQNSFVLSFARGILIGMGTTLGATIILTTLAFVLGWIAQRLGLTQALQNIVSSLQ